MMHCKLVKPRQLSHELKHNSQVDDIPVIGSGVETAYPKGQVLTQ
jgi:hypothetical protein